MQLARANILKQRTALASVARNTSCSRGWLHLTIQSIFAVITTVSFILILIMSLKSPTVSPVIRPAYTPKCQVHHCRVVCHNAPYFGDYEEDIQFAVSDAETKCKAIVLELNSPAFENNTLPKNWLSTMRSNIHQLAVIGGNLMHLSSGAFMSQFTGNTKNFLLQDLQIRTFETNSLVGLSELKSLLILNCEITCFETNALRAVDDTLETLTITNSGFWNPVNVTGFKGFEKLSIVDFSHNNFNNILDRHSFVGLGLCKVLYLNSCGIVSIGEGAFDSLTSIEVIYLNHNSLVTIPPGLFDHIVLLDNPRPRISLQDNLWDCNCEVNDLRQLVRKDILLVEATCEYPMNMTGMPFTEFEKYCANNSYSNDIAKRRVDYYDRFHINGSCTKKDKWFRSVQVSSIFRVVSPKHENKCSLNRSKYINIANLQGKLYPTNSRWLNYSFYLRTTEFSAIHIVATNTRGYGLIWFQSECPELLYCTDSMPTFLRVFNNDANAKYTFCPMKLSNGDIEDENCIECDMSILPEESIKTTERKIFSLLVYMVTVLICFCFGAGIVYGLIRTNPTLLKGNKRILFVKHKTVDALVLPPKVPIRNELLGDTKDKGIFTLSTNNKLEIPTLNRMKSVRSNKSNSPSYISALQPTEDQLAEWRIRHHFSNDFTFGSTSSDKSTFSWICDTSYYSLDESDGTYESLK